MEELYFDSVAELVQTVAAEKIAVRDKFFAIPIRDRLAKINEALTAQYELLGFVGFEGEKRERESADIKKYGLSLEEAKNPMRFVKIFAGNKETAAECYKDFMKDRCIRSVANEIFDERFGRVPLRLEQYIDMNGLKSADAILEARLKAISQKIKESGAREQMEQFRAEAEKYEPAVRILCRSLENRQAAKAKAAKKQYAQIDF
jgi:hypothetical protein